MLEIVLMRAFLMIYIMDFDTTDDKSDDPRTEVRSSKSQAFTVLSSVCWHWYWTLKGWTQSPTGDRIKHQLSKQMQREYFVFCGNYILHFEICCIDQGGILQTTSRPLKFLAARCEWFHCPVQWSGSLNSICHAMSTK